MSKSIFINLAIDQLWDSERNLGNLFSARIPESEYLVRLNEDLGIYLSEMGDKVFGFHSSKGFLDFLRCRNSSWGTWIEMRSNPFDVKDWLREARLEGAEPEQNWVFAGRSLLEQELLGIRDGVDSKQASLNRKTFLVQLAAQGLLRIPPTALVPQSDLTSGHLPRVTEPMLLKHEYGSGGGGNFTILSNADSTLVFIQRRLEKIKSSSTWLLQKKMVPLLEGCVFGDADGKRIDIAQVQYDRHGLSYLHQFSIGADLKSKVLESYSALLRELRAQGYSGPVGVDFIISDADQKVYFVDLNLRLTKTHLLVAAMQKLGIPQDVTLALRHRWLSQESTRFQPWWDSLRRKMRLAENGVDQSGRFVIPFLVAGIENPGRTKEVSLFVSQDIEFLQNVETALNEISLTSGVVI